MKKNTVIALLACIALYGCGYHAGALFRDDIRTIYVPVSYTHLTLPTN